MKICIVGGGAIGGLLGARLSTAGVELSIIERDEQLGAIRRSGLRLIQPDGTELHAQGLFATDDFSAPGPQDYVILAVKAHQIRAVAPKIAALMAPHTAIVTLQNGLPWWYFQRCAGAHAGRRLLSLDPDATLEAHLPAERIIGGVAYPAASVVAPGVIRLVEGDRFTLGEPDGSPGTRCAALIDALIAAGFKAYLTDDIRAELWLKAWGALSFNTVSALTGATMLEICREPATRMLVTRMMEEASLVAETLGVRIRHGIERRIAGAEKVGAHKTSMLQDLEAGREMEVDAVIGSLVELADITGTGAPTIRAIHACCALLNGRLRERVASR